MSVSNERWIDGLQFSSLFWPPPQDSQQRKGQTMAYVEFFGQFTSERFPEDVAELIQNNYPSKEKRLLDEVLAIFVLHHPEHGHAVVHPILSCIIDGTLVYDKNYPPFSSFISLFSQSSEKEYSEQWALACGEILRVLTHYNRPIYKAERQNNEIERSNSGNLATTSDCRDGKTHQIQSQEHERKPLRPLSPWITDILLTAPLGIRSDYFRWCGGVMGKYAAGGELKPPSTASGRGSGKHPQLMPSTPRWAVANGAGVILSVCDEEVARYETANLTAAAVPALLLPPPTTPLDEHLVAGLPALEPYARLFHRYYAIATPSATLRLLLGLLEAPPSWAPDALDAAVQLVELLRAAEDYASGMKLPRNWMHLHFLRAIGTAMSMRAGIAADAAAALLFRILSQPTLLFPPLRQAEGVDILQEPFGVHTSSYRKQIAPAEQASIEATAQGIASMLCAHGPDVEWKICTIWEAAYGLLPLSSSAVDLPEIIVATPLQPPVLSWNLYLPLLKVLEYLPRGSPSEACLMRIFVATVEAILRRTFPPETSPEENKKSRSHGGMWSTSKNLAVAELRTMVHSLFLESCASMDLASRLLFVVLTVCVSHEALPNGSKKPAGGDTHSPDEITENQNEVNGKVTNTRNKNSKKQGPVAAFDSYVLAAVCALACELQLFPLISKASKSADPKNPLAKSMKINGTSNELQNGISSAVCHTRRILGILEALFSLKPSSVGTTWNYSSNEIVAAAMVAAHVSELFGRSKACMHALSVLMRCKWDAEIYTRASSLYHLIDIHGKVVASIVNKAEPLEAYLVRVPPWKDSPACFNSKKHTGHSRSSNFDSEQSSTSQSNGDGESTRSGTFLHCEKALLLTDVMLNTSEKTLAGLPVDASDLANFLTMDRHIGFNCSAQELLRSVLSEKQELCFSVVSLLWHKMIAAPETQMSEESTSAQQGWRQVVVALCNVAVASPAKASTAVVLQAERDLQPWIARDDEQGQKMWRINQRIVKLIAELMRNHDSAESIIILASASDLLLRATDGMLVDGEACTLPQLELLEATARAVQLVFDWGESGSAVTDSLSNLLKCRLPATIRCLSHPSAHVRALSTSVLREILHSAPPKPPIKQEENNNIKGMSSPPYPCLNVGIIDWPSDVEKCLMWEAHSRRATGMTLAFLNAAAKELGCAISC
ncbi:Protein GIGANTEA [Acorus calamus]|uniref:Protein GIGANTEA n=1 Tax=Acorus calamus TaxID=4465 RepID=A0AAV9EGJ9_ACOCL|nr:Protein GIGANTEA [Acorus calamus]